MTSVNFYDKEQTDDLLTAKADASNVYTKSEIDAKEIGAPTDTASSTGSLWARIKNAVARIVSLETADADNVKKTGTSTVTGTIEVPTAPPTPTSVVNSVYVNDATAGVNNIAHKTGKESIGGVKTHTDRLEILDNVDTTSLPSGWTIGGVLRVPDKNGQIMQELLHETNGASNTRQARLIIKDASNNNNANLVFVLLNNGTVQLELRKNINGVSSSTVIATL